ncbi:MAG: urea ABC transporter permease subunit UrtB [Pseudomonadota bacterium]|nr:urea ABC transporter permease subunit UrtB [Pseudomonadota bacterium]
MRQRFRRSLIQLTLGCVAFAGAHSLYAETVPGTAAPVDQRLAPMLAALPQASYADKRTLIVQLTALHDPRVRAVLQALLDGNLYARTADNRLFIATADGDTLRLTDVLAAAAGTAPAAGFDKIGVNNQLRKELRVALAQFTLGDPEAAVRLAAVKEMLRALDEGGIAVLRARLAQEPDASVRDEMRVGLALADMGNADAGTRLAAVHGVAGSLNADVYNRLRAMVQPSSTGGYEEADAGVRAAAQAELRTIDSRRRFYSVLQTLLYGLSQGSVLVLAAIGLAITFGVMGVINMAHGELMMLGAYTTYVVQLLMPQHIGASIIVAVPTAFIISGLAGIAIERGIVRHLYGRPLETLLATFGVSLILQQAVRDIFSANNRPVETPQWLAGSLQINEVLSITYNRLYIVVFTVAVFLLLLAVLKRTRLGLEVRAVSQNRAMAKAMGVRTEWVDALTFGMGSGIAGVAGVALSQLTNVGPNLGQSYIVDSFMVVVFGGVGNLWGTELGGNALGIVNKVLEPYSGAVLAKIFVLVFLILFIQRRPRGLFPQKGRAADG